MGRCERPGHVPADFGALHMSGAVGEAACALAILTNTEKLPAPRVSSAPGYALRLSFSLVGGQSNTDQERRELPERLPANRTRYCVQPAVTCFLGLPLVL